jgi:hypothetical protein
MTAARNVLEHRNAGARQYRNMLLFLAADQRRLEELERGVAEHLAWTDIFGHWEELGLDAFGRNQAESKAGEAAGTVTTRIAETYHWALVPHQPSPTGPIEWETTKTDGQDGIALRASRRLLNAGSFVTAYAAELLRALLDDDDRLAALWVGGHVSVNEVWDAFARYIYLPRLRDIGALSGTAAGGSNSITWEQHGFAVADSFDAKTGRYIALVTGGIADHVTGTTLIVRPDLAIEQVSGDAAAAGAIDIAEIVKPGNQLASGTVPGPDGQRPIEDDRLRRFYAMVRLDPERYQRDFAKIAQEIVTNLAGQLGTEVELTLEILATNEAGFPDALLRTVNENARTLKLDQFGFERE